MTAAKPTSFVDLLLGRKTVRSLLAAGAIAAAMLAPAHAAEPTAGQLTVETMISSATQTCSSSWKRDGFASQVQCQDNRARSNFRMLATLGEMMQGEQLKRHREVVETCSKYPTGFEILRCYGELESVIKNGWATE
jgi:hypothetical protein